jgi:hypothetical protein
MHRTGAYFRKESIDAAITYTSAADNLACFYLHATATQHAKLLSDPVVSLLFLEAVPTVLKLEGSVQNLLSRVFYHRFIHKSAKSSTQIAALQQQQQQQQSKTNKTPISTPLSSSSYSAHPIVGSVLDEHKIGLSAVFRKHVNASQQQSIAAEWTRSLLSLHTDNVLSTANNAKASSGPSDGAGDGDGDDNDTGGKGYFSAVLQDVHWLFGGGEDGAGKGSSTCDVLVVSLYSAL